MLYSKKYYIQQPCFFNHYESIGLFKVSIINNSKNKHWKIIYLKCKNVKFKRKNNIIKGINSKSIELKTQEKLINALNRFVKKLFIRSWW